MIPNYLLKYISIKNEYSLDENISFENLINIAIDGADL